MALAVLALAARLTVSSSVSRGHQLHQGETPPLCSAPMYPQRPSAPLAGRGGEGRLVRVFGGVERVTWVERRKRSRAPRWAY